MSRRGIRIYSFDGKLMIGGEKFADWMARCVLGDFVATNPIDLVYALLSISTDNGIDIIPDYRATVEDVFCQAVSALACSDR